MSDEVYEEWNKKYGSMDAKDLAVSMRGLKEVIDDLGAKKTEVQKEYDFLRLKLIPELMESMGMSSMNIKGVGRLTVTADMYAGMEKGQKEAAYEWLTENGFGDLIKETVNSSTLKAFLKEQIKKGEIILPMDIFKITPFEIASITKG